MGEFILEIRKFIGFYRDATHPFEQDTSRKEKVWNKIAEVLGVPRQFPLKHVALL